MNSLLHTDTQPWATPAARVRERRARGPRRVALGALLGLAIFGTGLGGGVLGAVAATQWLAPAARTSTAVAAVLPPPSNPQAVSLVMPAPPTIAGDVFRKVNPSVVQIIVSGRSNGGRMGSGSGSGFVVDQEGHILSNNHVVEGARTISVRFSNGVAREAQVVGTDVGNDLAVLKVDLPQGIAPALLGNSEQVEVGDVAIAIGSPFGLDQTVTQGILSAVHRTWSPGSGRVRRNLLQTDAPINPGNSGGPLLNAQGEVIGITSMIESPIRANVGVGFAIPIDTAKRLLPQLEAGARLEPVWLGISGLALDAAIARDQSLPVQEGVLVTNVVSNGPAASAGVRGGQSGTEERVPRGGDVIVALNGSAIREMNGLGDQLDGRKAGDVVTLTIIRGGQREEIQVTLQPWPPESA